MRKGIFRKAKFERTMESQGETKEITTNITPEISDITPEISNITPDFQCNESRLSDPAHYLRTYYQSNTDSMSTNALSDDLRLDAISCDDSLACKICCEKKGRSDNYMILSCNHVFHVGCLAENHFSDVYNFQVIDSVYFSSRKCLVCYLPMQTEELIFLHSKFLKNTKDKITSHDDSISSLEAKMKQVKEELRACYDYKHKLEHEREKSKQIVSTLMTMM
jgi:hypothetical protein